MELQEYSNLLHRVKNLEHRLCKNFEVATGFSLTRYEMMMFLKEHNSCLQVDIQNYLQINQAAITRHLKLLEKEGLVNRVRNSENNREIFVSLTDFAKEKLAKCQLSSKEHGRCVNLSLNKEDLLDLEEALEKIENEL